MNTLKIPKTRFSRKTIDVINKLQRVLEKNRYFPTLGHFYREIELLKFPYMKGEPRWNYKNGRNVYASQQYYTIKNHCEEMGWITVSPKDNKTFQVGVNPDIANMKLTFIQIKSSGPYKS